LTTTTDRPGVDPRIWTRRVAVTRARGRKRLRIVIAGVCVCALIAGGFAAVHSSLFGARHLSVTGAVHTPTDEVLSSAGLLSHPPLIDIDASQSAKRVEKLPWIQSARVSVHWPDSVTVAVTERTAVGAIDVLSTGAAGRVWVLVDRSGRVLADQATRPTGLATMDVSVLPGVPGTYVPAADQAGVDVAGSLPLMLARRVTSIRVTPGTGVTLGLSGNLSAVIGAPDELQAKYVALASVLAGATLDSGDVINVSVPAEPAVGPANARR
jgi:cell division protein FtsQ